IAKMRGLIPNLVVRTTFIVGFPNETEESFRMLKDFVTEIGFDHLGVFTYSPEIGTAAEPLGDPIPEEIKNARRDELMALQAELAQIKTNHLVGTVMDVLVEGSDPKQDIIIGRTYRDAPEIDGLVVASGSGQPGEMIKVRIENTGPYDLFGTQV
ncbi:MAG: TRAM domain-containing protein, partial [Anaerolineaceae bacterium]|nr:TRAM domain-containing protein [Anaerolineaceae bacterium]